VVLEEDFAQVRQRKTGVEDIFDDEHVLAFDGLVQVLDELDGAGGALTLAVAGDGDEVECSVNLHVAARSARNGAAPLSTPTMTSFSPFRSLVICAPISATRSAICCRV